MKLQSEDFFFIITVKTKIFNLRKLKFEILLLKSEMLSNTKVSKSSKSDGHLRKSHIKIVRFFWL